MKKFKNIRKYIIILIKIVKKKKLEIDKSTLYI